MIMSGVNDQWLMLDATIHERGIEDTCNLDERGSFNITCHNVVTRTIHWLVATCGRARLSWVTSGRILIWWWKNNWALLTALQLGLDTGRVRLNEFPAGRKIVKELSSRKIFLSGQGLWPQIKPITRKSLTVKPSICPLPTDCCYWWSVVRIRIR